MTKLGSLILVVVIVVILGGAAFLFFRGGQNSDQNQNASVSDEGGQIPAKETIGTDPCSEFPDTFVANATGKIIVKTASPQTATSSACQYFVSDTDYISIEVNYTNVDDYKNSQIGAGKQIGSDASIDFDHFTVQEANGAVDAIVLNLDPNKYLLVRKSSPAVISDDDLIIFAAKVADQINNM